MEAPVTFAIEVTTKHGTAYGVAQDMAGLVAS
jgi:hypothetical protein